MWSSYNRFSIYRPFSEPPPAGSSGAIRQRSHQRKPAKALLPHKVHTTSAGVTVSVTALKLLPAFSSQPWNRECLRHQRSEKKETKPASCCKQECLNDAIAEKIVEILLFHGNESHRDYLATMVTIICYDHRHFNGSNQMLIFSWRMDKIVRLFFRPIFLWLFMSTL